MINVEGRTRNILLFIGAIITLLIFWYFRSIVAYILISVVLSFLGRPLARWLHSIHFWKFAISKTLAAFISLVVIWFFFIGFIRFIIPLLINEFEALSTINFNAVLKTIQEPLNRIASFTKGEQLTINNKSFFEILEGQLSSKFNFSQISNIFGFIAGTLGELLITFFSVSFITFFFLKEETMFRDGVLLIVPTGMEEKVAKILDSITYLLRRYFLGLMFEVIMVMLLVTLGLTIVGIEFNHAVIIGLVCGMFNVIPYLGPWMGALVGLLIGVAINLDADFMSQTLPLLGWMVVVFGCVQVVDNILFQPLIYSSSVKAHPLEIFLVIMAAGSMAGIIGMILAIPAYTILRVIAKEFFDNMKIVKRITKGLDEDEDKLKPKEGSHGGAIE
ncbi:Uncharacterized UPF0118 membrane protein [hydrothermal vent metagenome]|uniref:Uncharacterized UPF0118 membrane protein n=1 Tax=hydrothermal vent metagenome TaxID=652676 RepID=A0A3B0U1N9_9ZZZZ